MSNDFVVSPGDVRPDHAGRSRWNGGHAREGFERVVQGLERCRADLLECISVDVPEAWAKEHGLDALFRALARQTRVTEVWIKCNAVHVTDLLRGLAPLKTLRDISAFSDMSSGGLGDALQAFPELEELYLGPVDPATLASVAESRTVRKAMFYASWVSDAGLRALEAMQNLEELTLIWGPVWQMTPQGLERLCKRSPSLRTVTLASVEFERTRPEDDQALELERLRSNALWSKYEIPASIGRVSIGLC